jgi:transposase
VLDRLVPTHGNTLRCNALTNGEALCLWLVYLVSQADHRKDKVEAWAAEFAPVLSALWGAPVPASDFTDDRLTTLLAHLAVPAAQEQIDAALFARTVDVYALYDTHLRLDATVVTGYHAVTAGGIMQVGHGKGGPPGLAQCKVMAAATAQAHYVSGVIVPGSCADDPLYVPVIERVHSWLPTAGMLLVGDCKMSALATRARVVALGHYYYTPLSRTAMSAAEEAQWLAAAVDGTLPGLTAIWRDEDLLGYGYELTRQAGGETPWEERLHVVRSLGLAHSGITALERRLTKATAALRRLTPAPRPHVKQYTEEAALRTAVTAVLQQYHVEDLLAVTLMPDPTYRQGKAVRYVVTAVTRQPAAIRDRQHQCGWRVYVTNAPATRLGLDDGVLLYRQGAGQGIERMNQMLKDHDTLGLDRVFVHRSEQIVGLAYLVSLGLRLLTYLESTLRASLAAQGTELPDYRGMGQASACPTAKTVLARIAFRGVTLVELVSTTGQRHWRLSALPVILEQTLEHLGLPRTLYDQLNT